MHLCPAARWGTTDQEADFRARRRAGASWEMHKSSSPEALPGCARRVEISDYRRRGTLRISSASREAASRGSGAP